VEFDLNAVTAKRKAFMASTAAIQRSMKKRQHTVEAQVWTQHALSGVRRVLSLRWLCDALQAIGSATGFASKEPDVGASRCPDNEDDTTMDWFAFNHRVRVGECNDAPTAILRYQRRMLRLGTPTAGL
jgi:hypothetical protein